LLKGALQILINRYGKIRFAQVPERASAKSFVGLIAENSKSNHVGAQGTLHNKNTSLVRKEEERKKDQTEEIGSGEFAVRTVWGLKTSRIPLGCVSAKRRKRKQKRRVRPDGSLIKKKNLMRKIEENKMNKNENLGRQEFAVGNVGGGSTPKWGACQLREEKKTKESQSIKGPHRATHG